MGIRVVRIGSFTVVKIVYKFEFQIEKDSTFGIRGWLVSIMLLITLFDVINIEVSEETGIIVAICPVREVSILVVVLELVFVIAKVVAKDHQLNTRG